MFGLLIKRLWLLYCNYNQYFNYYSYEVSELAKENHAF